MRSNRHKLKQEKFRLNTGEIFIPVKAVSLQDRLPSEAVQGLKMWQSSEQPGLTSELTLIQQEVGVETS